MVDKTSAAEADQLVSVWEASVRATHGFLREEDLRYYKKLIRDEYLAAVDLFCVREYDGNIAGFMGISPGKVEMLFIRPDLRGRGIGKTLLGYAVKVLGIRKVDVNEQNVQALGFYRRMGFRTVGRTETDGEGRLYPVLEMELFPDSGDR